MVMSGKRVVLGVCGGIAAYKVADLCSKLVQAGVTVDVVMTANATRFVGPVTFQALTHRPVLLTLWDPHHPESIAHVGLAEVADLLVIAPATANVIAKLAHGIADDALTTLAVAARCPVVVCPAMDVGMYQNAAVQANLEILRRRGMVVVTPETGRLASGLVGPGRLPETPTLLGVIRRELGRHGRLAGQHLIITAGGTQEPLDPVRYIGNRSSGKMGVALAEAAIDEGADVTLIHTELHIGKPQGVNGVAVRTAEEMRAAVLAALPQADGLIMAAAVADFRPATPAEQKIKKTAASLTLTLVKTPDILAEVGARRAEWPRLRWLVGFAAETEELLAHAAEKLAAKHLDLIVANDVSQPGSGFGSDTNRVWLLWPDGRQEALPLMPKADVAQKIIAALLTSSPAG